MPDAPQVETDQHREGNNDVEDPSSSRPEAWVDVGRDPDEQKPDNQAPQVDQAAFPEGEPPPHLDSTHERHDAILELAGTAGLERRD